MKKIIIIVLAFFIGCKNNISVDIPTFYEKLVAISYTEIGDSSYIIYLNKTLDPLKSYYWKNIDTSFANATVSLSIDGIKYTLRRMESYEYHRYSNAIFNSYGRFFTLNKKIENISHLAFSAEYEGKKIESECTVLPNPAIISATLSGIESKNGSYTKLSLQIEANFPQGTSYYFIRVLQPSFIFYNDSTHRIVYQRISAKGFFVSDNAERHKEFYFYNTTVTIEPNHKNCIIVVSRIEKAYYDFALASQAQKGESDTFLPAETTEVPSNIRNGYGVFTAMKNDTVKVVLQ